MQDQSVLENADLCTEQQNARPAVMEEVEGNGFV